METHVQTLNWNVSVSSIAELSWSGLVRPVTDLLRERKRLRGLERALTQPIRIRVVLSEAVCGMVSYTPVERRTVANTAVPIESQVESPSMQLDDDAARAEVSACFHPDIVLHSMRPLHQEDNAQMKDSAIGLVCAAETPKDDIDSGGPSVGFHSLSMLKDLSTFVVEQAGRSRSCCHLPQPNLYRCTTILSSSVSN